MYGSLTNKITNLLLYIYFLLFLLSSVIFPFYSIYIGCSTIVEFAIITIVFVLNIQNVLKEKKRFMLFLITVLLVVISMFTTSSGIGSLFNITKFLMGILFFSATTFEDNWRKRLSFFCLIIWFVYLTISPFIWSLYKSGTAPVNPNTIGVLLFFTSTIIGTYAKKGTKKARLLSIIVYVLTYIAIINTQCRSAILAMSIFLALNYIPIFKPIVATLKKSILYIMTLAGTFFPVLYAGRSFDDANIDSLMAYSQKGLYTGREDLWGKMLNGLNADYFNYVIGMGSNYEAFNGTAIGNYHNWYFGIIYTFGVPVYLLYYYIFIDSVCKIVNHTILCGIIALMAIGFFETVGLNGGMQACIFMYFVLGEKK